MIRYGKHYIDNKDRKAVVSVLKSNWLTQGPNVERFENKLKNIFKSSYCCAVANGTAALHLAAMALNWKKNDIILFSPISFVSASNVAIHLGAKPDFVDIDKETYNISINELKKKISLYKSKNKKIKAIVATDFAGNPCNWLELKKISKKYNIQLVNDNCHALGASYRGDKHYSIKYADVVTQSFHPVKNITSAEGGAILTNNKYIYNRVKFLRTHGIVKKNHPWLYEMKYLGLNYRLSDIQCALGISQLTKLNKFIKKRNEIAKIYDKYFSNISFIQIPKVNKVSKHAYHLYPLLINFKKLKLNKLSFFKKLKRKNISLQVHYIPIHLQPYYKKKFGFKKGDFPNAENFYEKEISIPMFFGLKRVQQLKIIKILKKLINR